jgi:hypothetical protein
MDVELSDGIDYSMRTEGEIFEKEKKRGIAGHV